MLSFTSFTRSVRIMQLKLVHPECLKVQPCSQEHLEGGGLGGERVSTSARSLRAAGRGTSARRWIIKALLNRTVVCSLSVVLKAS